MDLFREYLEKEPWTSVCKLDTFEDNQTKYGILITRGLWYATRFYIAFPLNIQHHSPLHKAYTQSGFFPIGSYQNNEMDSFIVVIVKYKKKTSHWTLTGAIKEFANLKSNVNTIYDEDDYPKEWRYFEPFCTNEGPNSLEKLFIQKFSKIENLKFPEFDFKDANWKGIFTNNPLKGDKSLKCQEHLAFEFHGVLFVLVYDRTFYHQTDRPLFGKSKSSQEKGHVVTKIDWEDHYEYRQKLRLFGFKKKKNPIVLCEADYLDTGILENLFNKNWNKIFKPEVFCNILVSAFLHEEDWKNLDSFYFNDILKFGSILLVKRKVGYFHAGVYLGGHTVIHVSVGKAGINSPQEIFKIETIQEFAGDDKKMYEIRLLIPKFSKEELYDRAFKMKEGTYLYSAFQNNCEHLAFILVTDMKHSLQMQTATGSFLAQIFDFLKIGASMSA